MVHYYTACDPTIQRTFSDDLLCGTNYWILCAHNSRYREENNNAGSDENPYGYAANARIELFAKGKTTEDLIAKATELRSGIMIYYDPKYHINFDNDNQKTERLLIFHVFNYHASYHVRDVLISDLFVKDYLKETIDQSKERDLNQISFPDFSPTREKVSLSTYVKPVPKPVQLAPVTTQPKKNKKCIIM